MPYSTSNRKKFWRFYLCMFRQGFPGAKEIIEPELACFSTSRARASIKAPAAPLLR